MVSWKVCVEVYSKFVCNFRKSTVIQLSFKWSLLNLELTFHWVCYLQKNFMIISSIIPLKSAIYFKGQLTVIFDSLSVVFCYIFLGYMGKKIQILSSIRWCYRKMLATQECDLLQRPVNCNIWFSLCCFLLYFFGYMGKKIQILSSIRWCYRKMLEVIENILILTSVIDNLINCHLHMIVSFFDAARREWIILGSNGEMPSHP